MSESIILEFRKNLAAKKLQAFYRNYIKCDLDPKNNWPIDPIMGDSFDPKYKVRILYQTKHGNQIKTKLQCYDINTLWPSIIHSQEKIAINPLTNTKFTRKQFKTVLNKAIEFGFISSGEKIKYLERYGYQNFNINPYQSSINNNYSSSYEVNDGQNPKALFKKIKLQRTLQLIPYLALINDFDNLEKIIYRNLDLVEKDVLDINFKRRDTDELPKFPKECWKYLNKLKLEEITPDVDKNYTINTKFEQNRIPSHLSKYNALHAAIINQNKNMVIFLLQMGTTMEPISNFLPIHTLLLNDWVDLEILEMLKVYYTIDQLEENTPKGSAFSIAAEKIEIQPEIMQILFDNN